MPVRKAERQLKVAAGQATASGDTTVIAAPGAGSKIVIAGYALELRAAVATTMLLKDGASGGQGTLGREDGSAIGDGRKAPIWFPESERPKLTGNTALVLNLSGANATNYHVWYYIE